MKFKNRPNECVKTVDGREVWLSRSVAVTVCVLLECQGQPYILVNQRGPGMPDYPGYWNLPCGYLDYDETTAEAAVREVWEECGVNTLTLLPQATVAFFDQPWDVSSTPGDNRQNVTIHHGLHARVGELPAVSIEHCEPNETAEVRWLPLAEVGSLTYAFHHRERIAKFLDHLAQTAGIRYA